MTLGQEEQLIPAVGGVVFLIVAVISLVLHFRMRDRAISSETWPTTPGTVESATIKALYDQSEFGGSKPIAYSAKLRYRYTIGSQIYEGARHGWVAHDFTGSKDLVDGFIAKHSPGTTVTVHYDPNRPGSAALDPTGAAQPGFALSKPLLVAILLGVGGVGFIALSFGLG